ncbi:MAG: NADPH-dependent F420 reductase [Luteitalea sp.]|nr:NADPH-dependent F420 reductase [Acidobacteriota bacterium]
MNIGVIGAGKIGGLVGRLLVQAGHPVMFSSRHPESLQAMVTSAGPGAQLGTPEEAAAFGEVVLISVPFNALQELGRTLAAALAGKVVLDTGNPYPDRDGEMAREVVASGRGTGPFVAEALPGARVVRAFNTVRHDVLGDEAHRSPPRVGIPLASDDAEALEVASRLVRDAGFEPVVVGPLSSSVRFDVGAAVYNTGMSGPELRQALDLPDA